MCPNRWSCGRLPPQGQRPATACSSSSNCSCPGDWLLAECVVQQGAADHDEWHRWPTEWGGGVYGVEVRRMMSGCCSWVVPVNEVGGCRQVYARRRLAQSKGRHYSVASQRPLLAGTQRSARSCRKPAAANKRGAARAGQHCMPWQHVYCDTAAPGDRAAPGQRPAESQAGRETTTRRNICRAPHASDPLAAAFPPRPMALRSALAMIL
jgi:hypothetical protein